MGRPGLIVVVVAIVATSTAEARAPTPDEVRQLWTRLETARILLSRPSDPWGYGGLTLGQAADLRGRVVAAEDAIKRFVITTRQGKDGERLTAAYGGAIIILVADDITGIGTIDDVAIPVIAALAISTMILADGPAPPLEIDNAWRAAVASAAAAAATAEELRRRAATGAAAAVAAPLARERSGYHAKKTTETYDAAQYRVTACRTKLMIDEEVCADLKNFKCSKPEKIRCTVEADARFVACSAGAPLPAFNFWLGSGCGKGR